MYCKTWIYSIPPSKCLLEETYGPRPPLTFLIISDTMGKDGLNCSTSSQHRYMMSWRFSSAADLGTTGRNGGLSLFRTLCTISVLTWQSSIVTSYIIKYLNLLSAFNHSIERKIIMGLYYFEETLFKLYERLQLRRSSEVSHKAQFSIHQNWIQ